MLESKDLFVQITDEIKIGIKHIYHTEQANKEPIILIHGSAENGRIFYSKSMKGLAPFLASHSHPVYVVDLRGKGLSIPKISKEFNFNQTDVINDLKYVYDYILKLHPEHKQIWGAHSWGGVLINCFMLRNSEVISNIKSVFHFATKRSISVKSWKKYFQINFGFNFLMSLQARLTGMVAPKFFGFEAEAKDYHLDLVRWVRPSAFIDLRDGFDYFLASQNIDLPRALYISASDDPILGNPVDVDAHIKECHLKNYERWHLEGFDHNTLLTSKDAIDGHFTRLLGWI